MTRSPRRPNSAQYHENCRNWSKLTFNALLRQNLPYFEKPIIYLKSEYQTTSEKMRGVKLWDKKGVSLVHTSLPYPGIHWTRRAEIWCVVKPINCAFYAAVSTAYWIFAQVHLISFSSTSVHVHLFIAQKTSYWINTGNTYLLFFKHRVFFISAICSQSLLIFS